MCYSWWSTYAPWSLNFSGNVLQYRPLCRSCEQYENLHMTFQVLLDSCINKLSTLIRLYTNWYSILNKNIEAALIQIAVVSFRGMIQSYRENMSITFKRSLYLSLYFERQLKSARSISQISSIFVTVYGVLRNLFLTALYKVHVSWPNSHSSTFRLLFLPPLPNFATEPNTGCLFRIVINFNQTHYDYTDSEGTSFLSVNSCEINRVKLRRLLALILFVGL